MKDEFCPFLNPRYYLLDSTDPDDYLNRDNLFDMRSVENITRREDDYQCDWYKDNETFQA